MSHDDPLSRRRILQAAGATAVSTAVLAGCADNGEGPGEEEPEDEPAGEDEDPAEEEDPAEDENGNGNENTDTDGENENENESENDDNDEAAVDVEEWEGVDEIVLEGFTENWLGVEPEPIDGEENPTLVLFEGEEYDITWENMDGEPHNIEIWDEDGEVVDDYETELIEEEGEEQTLTIDEVTDEMVEYVCEVHAGTMIGDIQVETENGNGDTDDENGDNETDDE